MPEQPHVVVLGAGFGGLTFCQGFHHPEVPITLIDRQNHHLFQPLLYQVATSGLSPADIAQPIRALVNNRPNITVLLDEVQDIRLQEKKIIHDRGELNYSHLVIALGGITSYFGHPEWAQFAPGLKSLNDALRIRRETLLAFEKAEITTDLVERKRLLTTVVIGGGPTGVELAGAFAELARHVLRRDFRRIDPTHARVVLVESSNEILSNLPPKLRGNALATLEKMGVEVLLNHRVTNITEGVVHFADQEIHAANIIWGAGVAANSLTKKLGVDLDRAGRIKVLPDLSLPGHPEVFAIGDVASLTDKNGVAVPGVSPAAMQMAKHASDIIFQEIAQGSTPPEKRPAFAYWDKGTMATIGRSAAVAAVGKIQFTGFPAWLTWLFVHLLFLVGFHNKIVVCIQWFYSYITYGRGARIITGLKYKD